MTTRSCLYAFLLLLAFQSTMINATVVVNQPQCRSLVASTLDKIEFLTNLIIYKTELFLQASTGVGINDISSGLVRGPIPIGATVANLDSRTRRIVEEQGLSGVGHLRAIVDRTLIKAPIQRPQLNLTSRAFFEIFNISTNVTTQFNVYGNTTQFLLAANFANSILAQYLVEIIPSIVGTQQEQLIAGIALNTAAQLGVTRSLLNGMVNSTVPPFRITVANLTNRTAQSINQLGMCGVKNEGLIVPLQLGAENRTTSNVVPADVNSLARSRTEREVLRIVFGTGNATRPGGIFPNGLVGRICVLVLNLRLF